MNDNLRHSLHIAMADILYYSGSLRLWQFFRRTITRKKEVYILGLHRVLTDAERSRSNSLDAIVLTDGTFAAILEYLRQQFRIISLSTFLESETSNTDATKPWCLLTFDDGWRDNYTTAFPWLKKFGIPATIFLATGTMECCGGFWVEQLIKAAKDPSLRMKMGSLLQEVFPGKRLARDLEEVIEWLKHMPAEKRQKVLDRILSRSEKQDNSNEADCMLTWSQAVEMSRDGIDFGTHTVTHPLLSYEDDVTVQRELLMSKQSVEEKLGKKVRAFAYPNGDWDARVCRLVEQTGYECAFTTKPGGHCPGQDGYTIQRILLHEGNVTGRDGQFSPAILRLTLAGWA